MHIKVGRGGWSGGQGLKGEGERKSREGTGKTEVGERGCRITNSGGGESVCDRVFVLDCVCRGAHYWHHVLPQEAPWENIRTKKDQRARPRWENGTDRERWRNRGHSVFAAADVAICLCKSVCVCVCVCVCVSSLCFSSCTSVCQACSALAKRSLCQIPQQTHTLIYLSQTYMHKYLKWPLFVLLDGF